MRPGMQELLRSHSCRIETNPRTDSPARPEANIRQAANTDFELEYLPEFPANVRDTQRNRKVRIRRQGPRSSPVSPSVAFAGRDGHRRLGADPRYEVRKARLYAGESSPFSSSGRAGTSPAHKRTIRKTRNPPRTGRGGRRGDSLRGRFSGLFSSPPHTVFAGLRAARPLRLRALPGPRVPKRETPGRAQQNRSTPTVLVGVLRSFSLRSIVRGRSPLFSSFP